jgi:hypothetical protein
VVVSAATAIAGIIGLVGQDDDGADASAPPAPQQSTSTAPPATTTTSTLPATTTALPAPAGESPQEFLTAWVAAHRAHDVEFLLARLHPLVIERYGEEQCRAYLDAIDGSAYGAEVLSVEPGTAPWLWVLDGIETLVDDAITVQVRRTEDGTTFFEAEGHLVLVDTEISWFTDCGTPLAGAG